MKTYRSGMTSGTGIALFIVGLLIGAGAIYALAPSLGLGGKTVSTMTESGVIVTTTVGAGATITSTVGGATVTQTSVQTTTVTSGGGGGLTGTIMLGDLASLSGSLASYGQREKIAEDMAISDINAYLTASGRSNIQFAITHIDTATDPAKALTGIQTLAAQGVKAIVGPLSSGEASNILQYANSNKIVLCSQSSTAISLAIPNDYLFRLSPNDAAQGKAIAKELVNLGYKEIVVLNRHDTYGDGLAKEIINDFKAAGGSASANSPLAYDITTTDFTALLTSVQSDFNAAVIAVGASKVAIMAVTFETDGAGILLKAQSSFTGLLNGIWLNTDGVATSTIVANATTGSGQVAAKVKLLSTLGQPTPASPTAKSIAFANRFNATAHQPPDAYGPAAYDCTWLLALSVLTAGVYDGAAIQKAFPQVAANYNGVTGPTLLQDSGDRVPVGYLVYEVKLVNGTPTWVAAGIYDYGTDTLTWNQGFP
jgi:branched-chain amino acid transport system substrate-binding protein